MRPGAPQISESRAHGLPNASSQIAELRSKERNSNHAPARE